MITDFTKQVELIEVEKFEIPIHVVGVGSLGSWVTHFLLKMGFKNITIWDFDTIEEHNLPNQFYREKDIGKSKVDATGQLYLEFFTDEEYRIKTNHIKLTEQNANALEGIVFMCVDSMAVRKELYEMAVKYGQKNIQMWIEARLSIFGAYMYTITKRNTDVFNEYEKTLYDDEEAEVSVCGVSQTALPSATNTASMMVMQMISWWRGNDVYNKIEWSIPDLTVFKERW